jgi:carbon monoxide dehydrogenase subunit G
MSRVTKVVSIKADPAKVVEYISNVKNHPAFLSALKSVENISGDPKQVGTSWDWTFMMGGVELKGKGETAEYTPGKSYSFKTTSGIDSTFVYAVEAENGGSRLTMDVTYEAPNNVLSKIADKTVIERLNDEEGEKTVENLKAILGS